MKIEEIFGKAENGTLTLEQFVELAKGENCKFVDLSEDGYVSKNKYLSELEGKDKQIETLNDTVNARNSDLVDLKKQLEEAGEGIIKVEELNNAITELQGKYDEDIKNYKEQIKNQQYEFAVKEFANTKEFSSNAAKRDFIQSLIAANLKVDKDGLIGAEDFVKRYSADNEDAFVKKAPEPQQTTDTGEVKPQFLKSTPGAGGTKMSLSEMMQAANENPGVALNF